MKIITKLSHQYYTFNKNHNTTLLIELEAPKVKLDSERQNICVVPVLDVSGSMVSYKKLDYLKKACNKLIDHLSPGDYAGIIAYDSNVYEIASIREINQDQKEVLKKEVSKLVARTATNLSGGLIKAINWLNDMDLPDNTILRVILFTDGHANIGIRGKELSDLVQNIRERCSISCFGFGNDCSHELLANISSNGDGNFAFIDSADSALTAFGREFGSLISTYAQDIKIIIEPDTNNEVIEVLNDEDVSKDNDKIIITLRDILSQEKKWIVSNIHLNKVDKPFPRKVNAFKVYVEYIDRKGEKQKLETNTRLTFCKPGEEDKEDKEVRKCHDRLLASKAQIEADRFVLVGDFDAANNVFSIYNSKIIDEDIKCVMSTLSSNYANIASYNSSTGATCTLKKSLQGKRSYSSNQEVQRLSFLAGTQSLSTLDNYGNSFSEESDDKKIIPVKKIKSEGKW